MTSQNHSFEWAMGQMRERKGVRLPHWNPQTHIVINDSNTDKYTTPFFEVISANGISPWIPTFPEMFSKSWELFEN